MNGLVVSVYKCVKIYETIVDTKINLTRANIFEGDNVAFIKMSDGKT